MNYIGVATSNVPFSLSRKLVFQVNFSSKLTFLEPILEFLQKNYEKPSPIQSVSWPNALKGRDSISIAQTGSGKTLGVSGSKNLGV